MRTPPRVALAIAAALTATLAAVGVTSDPAPAHAATAAVQPFYNCYPNVEADSAGTNPECHLGPFIVQQPRNVPGQPVVYNDFVITDPNDAAQFWQGIDGVFEGTAPFCSTDKSLIHMVMCAGGNLGDGIGNPVIDLWTTARTTVQPVIRMHVGSQVYTITPAKIRLLDAMQRAGFTPGNVGELMRLLDIAKARGWRV